jgi:hypothetical protein
LSSSVIQLLVSDAENNLQVINTTLPPGQAPSVNSTPVVIANDQSAIAVKLQANSIISISSLSSLPTGTNSIGNVSVSSITLPGLSQSANFIGNVSVTILPGLPAGSNLIGMVNCNAEALIGAGAAPLNSLIVGGTYNSSPPSLSSGQTIAFQVDSSGKLLTDFSSVGLGTSANNIGLVNTNADALIGVGTAPAKAFITGGVYNSSAPSPSSGQTVALQLDATGKLLVNTSVSVSDLAISAGSNVIGTVNCAGLAAPNTAPSTNPVYIGGIYNSTQPVFTSNCIAPMQFTARGAQIVATGVDTLNASITTGLPTSSNQIGTVVVTSGIINTNADAAIGAGAAPGKALITGGVYNSSAPAPSTGQTVALQLDAAGRLITNSSVTGIQGTTAGGTPASGNNVLCIQGAVSMVVVQTTEVGNANWPTSQISINTTATSLVSSRAGRQGVVVTNLGTTPIYLGGSAVTTSNGAFLAGIVGASKMIPFTGAVYGIVGVGTQSVSVEEYY